MAVCQSNPNPPAKSAEIIFDAAYEIVLTAVSGRQGGVEIVSAWVIKPILLCSWN